MVQAPGHMHLPCCLVRQVECLTSMFPRVVYRLTPCPKAVNDDDVTDKKRFLKWRIRNYLSSLGVVTGGLPVLGLSFLTCIVTLIWRLFHESSDSVMSGSHLQAYQLALLSVLPTNIACYCWFLDYVLTKKVSWFISIFNPDIMLPQAFPILAKEFRNSMT